MRANRRPSSPLSKRPVEVRRAKAAGPGASGARGAVGKSSAGIPAARAKGRAYKVDLGRRIGAAMIDATAGFVAGLVFLLWGWWPLTAVILGLYMLVRDGLPLAALDYQSVGKKLLKLHVENEKTHKPRIDIALSAKRNATLAGGLLLAPLAGMIALPLAFLVAVAPAVAEIIVAAKDPNGLRFGDTLAGTKVLD